MHVDQSMKNRRMVEFSFSLPQAVISKRIDLVSFMVLNESFFNGDFGSYRVNRVNWEIVNGLCFITTRNIKNLRIFYERELIDVFSLGEKN